MTKAMPMVASAEAALGTTGSYWSSAARQYTELRPPLRPCAEDILFFEETAGKYALQHPEQANRALLLGVTPDIAQMRWPSSFSLLGVDRSNEMVNAVWPGNISGKRWAVNGDWLSLPQPPASCDIAIGDGSLNCLRYPDQHRAFLRSVCTALKAEGILVLRCFTQPEQQERTDQLFEAALRGEIPTFTQFRLRLLMAMQRSTGEGVAVSSVYRFWADRSATQMSRLRALWPKADIDYIELYRDAGAVHTFPTLAECRAVLSEFFDEVSASFPTYYAGERCPRLVLTPRWRAG